MKTKCDRCGREFTGSAYYTIDIYGRDVNPTNDGRASVEASSQNIATNMFKLMGLEKHFCKSCIDEIQKLIYTTNDKVANTNKDDRTKYFEELLKNVRKENR